MAMSTIESINLIYRDTNVRGGRPCIVGTDLRVLDIIISKIFSERTPDELARDYDLSMAEVHAALAYYYGNKDEIDADIREDVRRSDELAREGLGAIERPVYEDVSTDLQQAEVRRVRQAVMAASAAQAVDTELKARAEQVLKPIEQEVE